MSTKYAAGMKQLRSEYAEYKKLEKEYEEDLEKNREQAKREKQG